MFYKMRLIVYFFSIFLVFYSSNLLADREWLSGQTFEICEVKQDYAFNYYSAEGDDFWKLSGKINFIKGDLWGLKKHKDGNVREPVFINGNMASSLKYKKNDKYDKIELTDGYTKQLSKEELFECYKNQVSRKEIKYQTHNIFTQNDLFDGLKIALGGINEKNIKLLNLSKFNGFAAVQYFDQKKRPQKN